MCRVLRASESIRETQPSIRRGACWWARPRRVDSIGSSRDAYAQLFKKLKKALGSGGEAGIEIVEGGVSPYMAEAEGAAPASVPGKKGQTWRITADPLRMRSSEDASGASNILARLPLGTLVTTTGKAARTGWLHARAELDGAVHEGFISSEYAEAVRYRAAIRKRSRDFSV